MTDRRDIKDRKAAIRETIRGKRQELEDAWIQTASAAIQEKILELGEFRMAAVVSVYMALRREVQTARLIETAWELDKKVCVPCLDEATSAYAWAWIEPGDPTTQGHWHTPELPEIRWADRKPDVIIAPAVAVDRAGHRLGHGGGHYDRLLAMSQAPKVAAVFAFQVVDEIPVETWDQAVDVIVTENDLFKR